jgi:hypothetical protein
MITARRWTAVVSKPAIEPRKSICLMPPSTARVSLAVCGVASPSSGRQNFQFFSALPNFRARSALPMKSASELIEAASSVGGVTSNTETHRASAWPPTRRACGPQCARISRTSSGVRAISRAGSVTQFRCRPANAGASQCFRLDQHDVRCRQLTSSHKVPIARLRCTFHLPEPPAGNSLTAGSYPERQASRLYHLAQKQSDSVAHLKAAVGQHSSRFRLEIGFDPSSDYFGFHAVIVATLGYRSQVDMRAGAGWRNQDANRGRFGPTRLGLLVPSPHPIWRFTRPVRSAILRFPAGE